MFIRTSVPKAFSIFLPRIFFMKKCLASTGQTIRPPQMSYLEKNIPQEVLLFRKLSVNSSQRNSFARGQKLEQCQNLSSVVTSANDIPISCSQNAPAFRLCTQACIEKTCLRTHLTDDSSWVAASNAGSKSTHNVSNSTSRSDLSDEDEDTRIEKPLNYRRRFGIVEKMIENDVMEVITHIATEACVKVNMSDREIRLGPKLRYKRRCSVVRTMIDNASLILIPDLETSKKRRNS